MKIFGAIILYFTMGIWLATHYASFYRHCQKELPVGEYVVTIALWPLPYVYTFIDNVTKKDSFTCELMK